MRTFFGTDGIRDVVNEKLTSELAMKLGNAVANLFGGKYKKLYLARDTRNSGKMLELAIASGALAAGMDVESCGILTTPALAYITRTERAVGIVISASHNPSIYNGLKVLCEGYKISDEMEEKLEDIMLAGLLKYCNYKDIGTYVEDSSKREYIDYVISSYSSRVSSINYKIAVDVANGAAGAIIDEIFGKLGLNYDVYFNSPDGLNINENCGSTSWEPLSKIIKKGGYDLGVLFDGDADRCLFLDSQGNLVDGDALIGINSLKLKKQGRLKNNFVVATVMSNLGLEDFLKANGLILLRSDVGDKYVLELMLQENGVIGGEQSGHIIFLDRSTTGDGIITALETLEALAFFSKRIEDLVSELPKYPQDLKNITVKDKMKIMKDKRLEELKKKYEHINNFRVLVRPSGTEHIIRVMSEGEDKNMVNECIKEFSQLIQNLDKEY